MIVFVFLLVIVAFMTVLSGAVNMYSHGLRKTFNSFWVLSMIVFLVLFNGAIGLHNLSVFGCNSPLIWLCTESYSSLCMQATWLNSAARKKKYNRKLYLWS